VNERWPQRSKASDGAIGDTAHARTASDHNPNHDGIVCALDITHDPTNGPDIEQLGTYLANHPHPDCKYLIFNRKLASRLTMWQTRPYTGDPHTNHLHISVGIGPDGKSRQPYDDTTPWLTTTPPPPTGNGDMTAEEHAQLNNIRADVQSLHVKVDQVFTKLDALTKAVDALPDT
jgi:hypothetical protein